jgi:YfiR/HmsC-like
MAILTHIFHLLSLERRSVTGLGGLDCAKPVTDRRTVKRHKCRAPNAIAERSRDRRAVLCALFVAAVGWIVPQARIAIAEEPQASEDQVKAAFLVNFAKYVDWPAEAFAGTNSPIVIAVPGETKVAEEVQKAIAGRTVNGREIVLKRPASGEAPGVCHILFISAAEQERSPNLLVKLKNASVLTVGESDDFLEDGGIINLTRRDRKIALEVNLTAASNARIKISSKLLNVASVVKGKSK